MASDNESDAELDENYYTFLNLPRDATQEQINSAYRKQSRIYHPDKHQDPESKQKAEMMFNRTKRAYEVLSDPHQRAIYDSVGEKGLKTEGWEIVHRTKTPAEIREEYERLAQAAAERRMQQRTNPRGNITINVNATEIFTPYDESEMPRVEIGSMSIAQSIEAPITRKDMIVMSGNLYSSNGTGNGGFMIAGRRLLNKGWLEICLGAGNGFLLGLKGGRTLTSKVSVNGGTNMNFQENGVIPAVFSTLAVQLDKHTIGSLTLNAGPQSSMTTQIDHSTDQHAISTSFVLGTPHIYFTMSYTRKMLENEMKLKLSAKVGTFGFMGEYGVEKKVSKYSSLVATVSIGVPSGVILKLKIIRSNQSYVFPIHLSDEIVPAAVFYASVTPIIAWFFVKKAIMDPMEADRKSIEVERSKRQNEQRLVAKKLEAMAAIHLMQSTYNRITNEEQARKGLIITRAIYGCLSENSTQFKPEASHDVTIPIQCLVRDGILQLYESSKSDLPGFFDPSLGDDKILRIEYTFNDVPKTINVKDNEPVRLPG
ncbi:dnaJ homolog subfamily C member 11 isoform X1 [Drosophila sulfurigaster albostrigata]|uniref:DnaJ homolog subfamily C member 11 isoform X1 n=2 Tax=Drosophila albomicans TaxID=7291 RepID=A0A6P8YYQ8_DROAB|nr:dnaJ homolog subfamily C member 11 isoform X1 [Drosophila albomicans]XP_060657791.1 dnaJ homolog subfamily C member 11 isoform X1 [Drosophila nasuta]XP_062135741.1 dnaJ homolog subfamily C member 11 isoform X1 [Drosophila sulfurigaster albostrigata]